MSRIFALWSRLRDRLQREQNAAELDSELEFHMSSRARDFRATGMSDADAVDAARRELGNRAAIREESRDMWSFRRIEDAMQDLRFAVRILRRSPVYAIVAVLTLALGIGATAAIFTVVHGVLLRPLPYGNPERLAGAWHDMPGLGFTHMQQSVGTYFTYQRLAKTVEGIGAYQASAANVADVAGPADAQRIATAWFTASMLPVLQVSPIKGRNFSDAEDRPHGPRAVIVSEGLWRSRFGGADDILTRSLEIGGVSTPIVGVMPANFRFPLAETEMWLPLALDPVSQNPGGFNYNSVIRLKAGTTIDDVEREFAAILPRMAEFFPQFMTGTSTQSLLDQAKPRPSIIPLRKDITGGIARTLWMVAAAAGLVLVVAGANVASLMLVRIDGRKREMAVRESLGAGRMRLTVQFFAEAAVLAGVAAAFGLGLTWLAVRALVAFGPPGIPRLVELRVDGISLAFVALAAVLSVIGCTALPSIRIARTNLPSALREGGRTGTSSRAQHRVRAALVAGQMALALVALAGSGLIVRTYRQLSTTALGFEAERVLTLWVSAPASRYANDTLVVRFYEGLAQRIREAPGVQAVGLASRLPLHARGSNANAFYPEGDPSFETKVPPLQMFATVNGEYFKAMAMPLSAGRTFESAATQRGDEAIISRRTAETFYRDSTGRAALGKRFRSVPAGTLYTIIGVVGDVRDSSLAAPIGQAVYFPEVPTPDTVNGQVARTMAITVRTAEDPMAALRPVREAIRAADPSLPAFDVQPMSSIVRASMAQLTFVMLMLGVAAAVTLVLGAIGLYGVMASVVTLRTKEFGVRLALGAAPGAMAGMVARQGLLLAAFGSVTGFTVFAFVAEYLRSFLVGVAPNDPIALSAALLLLVTIALFASLVPALRASRIDPAETLRAE